MINRLIGRVTGLARVAATRTDVVIAAFMLMAVVMMIIPLPTWLVDMLIGVNIALSILILIVAFYISKPIELSSLPALILLSTLFRLSLSITTTRLILLHANAGHIVEAFGDFVIAGQVVVGLVIFLIITIAQFVVITKGAERVAEVAARFTLDAMPGKQMAIDNDLRNGDIDQPEARRRRTSLQRESQLFGAMDGAMKFVKGDAIAGLVILAVNLIGGLLIGMLERNMSFADAAHTYSLLTVGDGLIAQIPALLIAVAAGTVVTRVNNEDADEDLGTEIIRQMGASQRALSLTAIILLGVAFIPGFPAFVFLALAGALGMFAYVMHRRRYVADSTPFAESPASVDDQQLSAPPAITESTVNDPESRVTLLLGPSLAENVRLPELRHRLQELCATLQADLGLSFVQPSIHVEQGYVGGNYQILLEGVPVAEGEILLAHVLLEDDVLQLELLDIPFTNAPSPLSRRIGIWVAEADVQLLEAAGVSHLPATLILRDLMAQTLRRHSAEFFGIQEIRHWLAPLEQSAPDLVKEALRVVPIQRMAEALRQLVADNVSVRNRRALLEAMVACNSDMEPSRLADHLRVALARQISHQYADKNRVIGAFVISARVERQLLESLRSVDSPRGEGRERSAARHFIAELRNQCMALSSRQLAVLVTHPELRRPVARWRTRERLEVAVLSFTELAPEYNLHAIKVISLNAAGSNEPAGKKDLGSEAQPAALESNV